MVAITAAVSILGVIIVLRVRPARALGVLIVSILLYPEYLRISVGLAQMSAPRLIAIAIVLRMLPTARVRGYKWRAIDFTILAWWVWDVLANCIAGSDSTILVYTIGGFFDTVLMYFCARLTIMRLSDLGDLILPIFLATGILACVGIVEAVTHYSMYHYFEPYYTAARWGVLDEYRFGMLRARGSSGIPACFGVTLCFASGVLFAIRGFARWRWIPVLAAVVGSFGVLSSLSSGPMLVLVVFVASSLFAFYPALIKPVCAAAVLLCVGAELMSNRHFYYLTEYLNFFGGDYWYRCRLFDVAIRELHEYWLVGIGGRSIAAWAAIIDGRTYVDLVNMYVCIALSGGVLGVILFTVPQILVLRSCVCAYRIAGDPSARRFCYSMACLVLAIMASCFQAALLDAPCLLAFIALGMAADVERLVGSLHTRKRYGSIFGYASSRRPHVSGGRGNHAVRPRCGGHRGNNSLEVSK